ncbi:Pentapeptide repeat family protein [Minicystis rosea]|nr:Pentapeptide repeat family protein [Minicystis rosea]
MRTDAAHRASVVAIVRLEGTRAPWAARLRGGASRVPFAARRAVVGGLVYRAGRVKRTALLGGEATMKLDAGAPRVEVTARLDLVPPLPGSVLCRMAPAAIQVTWDERRPSEGARLVVRGKRRATISLFEGGEQVIVADLAPSKGGEIELACARLGEGMRIVVDDGEPHAWQLPGIAPAMRVWFRDATAVFADLAAAELHVDLDARAIALFWRGEAATPRELHDLVLDDVRLEGAFVPATPVSAITTDLDAPPPPPPGAALVFDNRTGLAATSFAWQLRPPTDAVIVVVKGTFDLVDGVAARPSEAPSPLSGERRAGSEIVTYPGDFAPFKPRADVIVQGHAHAKPGARVARVEVRVGALSTSLVALGPRRFLPGGAPSEPELFDRVALSWEHAFGGREIPANPAGTGVDPSSAPPQIERPDELLRRRGDRPRPIGFGAVPPSWEPRAKKLGAYGRTWQKTRWPFFPEDFDWSYWNAAPAEMTVEHLRGDEDYRLTSVLPGGGDLEGSLPGRTPRAFAVGAKTLTEVPMRLDTAVFDADRKQVVLVWRGALELDRSEAPPREILLIEDPVDALRSMEDVERIRVAGEAQESEPATKAKGSAPSSLLREIRTALAARRPLPSAASAAGSGAPAMVRPEAPRVSRGMVQRWLAAGERLAGRDLSGADLSGLDFSGRDLTGTVLRGTNLDDANLDGASCEGLRATDLRARRSSWKGAKLTRADLARADLSGADLSGAHLDQTSFADAELTGVTARGASASGAQLVRARLIDARFDEAKLDKADLSHATMDGAHLVGATLDDAKLYEVLAEGLVADRASLADARFELARLDRASFKAARGAGSMWERASLGGADFTDAVLIESGFAGADLVGARFGGADLAGARFVSSKLERASFVRANVMRASFEDADMRGADFSGANLYQAETWRARMEGAKLAGALTKGTKIGS